MKRGDIYWVNLDPTIGSEVKKCRPAVILSPDEMNQSLPVVIVAPFTSARKPWPTRQDVMLDGKSGQIMLDQIRTVDKARLLKPIGNIDVSGALAILQEMFAH